MSTNRKRITNCIPEVTFGVEVPLATKIAETAEISAAHGGLAYGFCHNGAWHEVTMKASNLGSEKDFPVPRPYSVD